MYIYIYLIIYIYIWQYIHKIGNEASEMINKWKMFSSKLVSCIQLRTLFNTN